MFLLIKYKNRIPALNSRLFYRNTVSLSLSLIVVKFYCDNLIIEIYGNVSIKKKKSSVSIKHPVCYSFIFKITHSSFLIKLFSVITMSRKFQNNFPNNLSVYTNCPLLNRFGADSFRGMSSPPENDWHVYIHGAKSDSIVGLNVGELCSRQMLKSRLNPIKFVIGACAILVVRERFPILSGNERKSITRVENRSSNKFIDFSFHDVQINKILIAKQITNNTF